MREFVDAVAGELGMKIRWSGAGVEEKGYDEKGRCIVAVDPRYFRPAEVESLLGDSTKARTKLGWKARTSFRELVAEMAQADLRAAEQDRMMNDHGYASAARRE